MTHPIVEILEIIEDAESLCKEVRKCPNLLSKDQISINAADLLHRITDYHGEYDSDTVEIWKDLLWHLNQR